jgi:carbamoyltransferase
VLINTSFNIRGEPIVCTAEDAYRCFLGSHIDVLVVEDELLYRHEQAAAGDAAIARHVARFARD